MNDVFGNSAADQQWSNETTGEQVFGPNSEYHGFDNLQEGFDNFTNGVQAWWDGSRLNPKNWFNHMVFGNNVAQSTNSAVSQGKLAYTSTGIPYDESNIDSQINALAQEYAYKRDDESYDRLFAALKRNGVNPALILGNASPLSSDAPVRSNYNMTTKDQVNSALKVATILALLMRVMK